MNGILARVARIDRAYAAATGTIGATLALQLVVALSGVIAARMLGVTGRGHSATLWLVVVILGQLGTLGMPSAVTYFVARNPSAARAIVRLVRRPATVQALTLVGLQALTLVVVLRGEALRFALAGAVTLAILPPLVAQEYGLALLQGQQRFRAFNLMRLLPYSLYALALAVAFVIDNRSGLILVTGLWVLTAGMSGVTTVAVARAGLPGLTAKLATPTPTPQALRRFGLQSVLGTATVLEQLQLDQAIVAIILPQSSLGLYVAAVAFANLPRFVGLAIGTVAYPDVAGRSDSRQARRRVWFYVLIDALVCGVIAGTIELLVSRVLPLFFGPPFAAAVPVAQILVLSGFLQSIRRVLSDGARGIGHPGLATFAEITSWVVLAPSLLLLTPSLGLRGVAWALVVAPAVATVVLVVGLLLGRRPGHGRGPRIVPLTEASGVTDASFVTDTP